MLQQIRELLCDVTGIRYPDEQLQNYIDQGEALLAYTPVDKLPEEIDVGTLKKIVIQEWTLYRVALLDRDIEKASMHLNALRMLFKIDDLKFSKKPEAGTGHRKDFFG